MDDILLQMLDDRIVFREGGFDFFMTAAARISGGEAQGIVVTLP